MKNLQNCPNCGGDLSFNPHKQAIWCEHCESVFPIEIKTKNVKITRKYSVEYMPESNEDELNQYYCNNCGSTHVVINGKISKRCPGCGSKDVTPQVSNSYSPDGLIPFAISKEEATKCFDKWIKKRKFAPNDLFVMAKQGKLSSVYVPVYNISATNVCFYNGTVKKVHINKDTNTVFSTVHMVKDVDTMQVNKTMCANSTISDEYVNNIIDIDVNKIVPYSSSYLFGFTAVNTNETLQSQVEDLKSFYKNFGENSVRNKLKNKYDEIVNLSCDSRLENIFFNYLYVPVYMNHYTYKGKDYHCYISGINGKATGKSPKSALKILATIGGVIAAVGIVGFLIAKLLLKF